MPAPLIFGAVFDRTCILWQEHAKDRGSCWVYDNDHLSIAYTLTLVSVMIISGLFYVIAWAFYRHQKHVDTAQEPPKAGIVNEGAELTDHYN